MLRQEGYLAKGMLDLSKGRLTRRIANHSPMSKKTKLSRNAKKNHL
jgi:hypothetical protein